MENILKGLLCKDRQPLQNLMAFATKSLIDFKKYLIGWKCLIAPLSMIESISLLNTILTIISLN